MFIGQSTSANIIIGPLLNPASASVMITLDIDNDAIWLHKNGGASTARSNATSALSVSPGFYRVVLNTADTDTLGELVIAVSGSGAILFRKDVQIWQKPTFDLMYNSADTIATSAGVSAIVTVAVAQAINDSDVMMSATFSAQLSAAMNSYRGIGVNTSGGGGLTQDQASAAARQALIDYDVASSADVSAIVSAVVQGVAMTSASLSSQIETALTNHAVLTSTGFSAQLSAALNSYQGIGVATSGGAGGITSANASVLISAVVQRIFDSEDLATSANLSVLRSDVSADQALLSAQIELLRVSVSADQALTSSLIAGVSAAVAGVSAAVAAVSARVETVRVEQSADQALLSAQIAGISALVLTSAETSAIVEQAVFQRALDEPTGAPSWAGMNYDVAIEWMTARNTNRVHQASTSVAIFNSADSQIASASVGITSTSANQDQFL